MSAFRVRGFVLFSPLSDEGAPQGVKRTCERALAAQGARVRARREAAALGVDEAVSRVSTVHQFSSDHLDLFYDLLNSDGEAAGDHMAQLFLDQ